MVILFHLLIEKIQVKIKKYLVQYLFFGSFSVLSESIIIILKATNNSLRSSKTTQQCWNEPKIWGRNSDQILFNKKISYVKTTYIRVINDIIHKVLGGRGLQRIFTLGEVAIRLEKGRKIMTFLLSSEFKMSKKIVKNA